MESAASTFDECASVSNLKASYNEKMGSTHIKDLLQDDARNQLLVAEHSGVILDYTHTKIDEEHLK